MSQAAGPLKFIGCRCGTDMVLLVLRDHVPKPLFNIRGSNIAHMRHTQKRRRDVPPSRPMSILVINITSSLEPSWLLTHSLLDMKEVICTENSLKSLLRHGMPLSIVFMKLRQPEDALSCSCALKKQWTTSAVLYLLGKAISVVPFQQQVPIEVEEKIHRLRSFRFGSLYTPNVKTRGVCVEDKSGKCQRRQTGS